MLHLNYNIDIDVCFNDSIYLFIYNFNEAYLQIMGKEMRLNIRTNLIQGKLDI